MDYLKILGRYEIDGQLLVPLRGNGDLNITTGESISYRARKVMNKLGKCR